MTDTPRVFMDPQLSSPPSCPQVISDHVLRLDQLIHEDGGSVGFASASDDTSSSATSSGAESEDDTPRSGGSLHPQPNHHTQVRAKSYILVTSLSLVDKNDISDPV